MLRPLAAEPRRILIIRTSAIGDVVRVLPMLNGLKRRFPDAEIDWLVQAKSAGILASHPQIDRLFVVSFRFWRDALSPDARRLRRQMRAREYDLVLDFQGKLRSAVWALVVGRSAVRVGWGPGHTWEPGHTQNVAWLWYHGLRYPQSRRVNRHLRHRSLVDWLDVPDLPGLPPCFPADEMAAVDHFVASLDDASRPWILAWPGSSVGASHKRWEPGRLERALRDVRSRTGGTVLIGWGPAEAEEARALAAALDAPLIPPPGTIAKLAYLLTRCDLYLGMDTGPMHLAGLVGTPVVAVFGRTDPVLHGPAAYLPGRVVAGSDSRTWPRRKRARLPPFTDPAPETVVEAALGVLAEHPGARRGSERGSGAVGVPPERRP